MTVTVSDRHPSSTRTGCYTRGQSFNLILIKLCQNNYVNDTQVEFWSSWINILSTKNIVNALEDTVFVLF